MSYWSIGVTGRSPGQDVRHAVEPWLPKASRTGRNYRTVCGASVRRILPGAFDPAHDRACPGCRKETSRGLH